MQMNALQARPRRRQFPKDQGERSIIAPNMLERVFDATAPNQKLGADFTYIGTAEGWLYVAVVIDRFSRRGVGWSPLGNMLGMRLPGQWMKDTMIAQMVTDALMMAIWRRGWPKDLIHYSDQGRQYTSEPFQRLVTDHGVTCSMSRSGNVWEFKLLHASGKLLRIAQDQTGEAQSLANTRPSPRRCLRLHRTVLQSDTSSLDHRISKPYAMRGESDEALSCRPRNRQQIKERCSASTWIKSR
jgi:hypothetical protein